MSRFGGLDVFNDPDEVAQSGAVDMINVDVDRRGKLRTREGYTQIVSVPAAFTDTAGFTVFDEAATLGSQFIVGYNAGVGGVQYQAFESTGGSAIATQSLVSSSTISSARIATPTASYLYLTNGVDIYRWDGGSFTTPAGMPKAAVLAATPYSSRLVAANTNNGVTNYYSRVQFSDAGAPETFGANNYVDISPGNGIITTAATWRDLLFVFKDRVGFYVFTNESTDSSGNPIFNYRAVTGYGAFACAAGDEGVYFIDGRSVWLTTGDTPTKISENVEPFLHGDVSINGQTVDQTLITFWRMSYSLGRLFLSVWLTNGNFYTLVFDPRRESWTTYDAQILFAATLTDPTTFKRSTFWLSPTAVNQFSGATTDNGTAISWKYKTGRYEVAGSNQAVANQTSLVGSGTATLTMESDRTASGLDTSTSASATLGTAPAELEGWPQPVDVEGTWFQATLSGSGPAVVSEMRHHVNFVQGASDDRA